jgi:pectin methylesterase-like acyl-CoA thioesterase
MVDFQLKRHVRLAVGVAVAAAALTLAACGGSDHNVSNTTPPLTGSPPPASTEDSFITIVKGIIAFTGETAEPGPVTGVTATAPENTEPEPTP